MDENTLSLKFWEDVILFTFEHRSAVMLITLQV